MPRDGFGREKGVRFEQWRNPKVEEGGIVRITGAFLLDHSEEILNLIKHEGKLAEEKNPNHKVSKIEKVDGGVIVETTDHNLAMKIGKALVHSYRGKHKYKFSKGEKFVEVDWIRD